jgi:hypothetical protein
MQSRKFSREFKIEAVKPVRDEGCRWRKQAATWVFRTRGPRYVQPY